MKDICQKGTIAIWILLLPNIMYASGWEGAALAILFIDLIVSLAVLLIVFIISSFLLKGVDFSLTKNIVLRFLFSINIVLIAVFLTWLVFSILNRFINPLMSYLVWPVFLVIFSALIFRYFLKKTLSFEKPLDFQKVICFWLILLNFLLPIFSIVIQLFIIKHYGVGRL